MTQYRKSPFKTSDLFLSGQKVYAKIGGSYFPITLAPPKAYVELEGGRLTWEGDCYVQVADETPNVLDKTKYQQVGVFEAKKLLVNGTQVFRYDLTGKTCLVEYTDLKNIKFEDYCGPILPSGYYYVAIEDLKKPEPPKGRTTAEAFIHVLTTGQPLYGTLRENGSTFRLIRDSGRIRCQQFVGGSNKVSADPPIDATWFEKLEEPPIPAPVKGSGPHQLSLQDIRLSLSETRKNWPGLIDLFWTITPKPADPTPLPEAIRELLQKDAGEVKFYGNGGVYRYFLGKKRTDIYCTCSSDPTREVPIPTGVLWYTTPLSPLDSTQGNATVQGVELPAEFTKALEHAQSYWRGPINLSWTLTPWKKA